MTLLYKLTDSLGQTYGKTQWGEGVEHTASGEGGLCGHGWIHAYTDPLLAVLLNPIHANFKDPLLWEGDGDVSRADHGLKVGCTRLRTLRRIPLPNVTLEQRITFTILCGQEVCVDEGWCSWAARWLSGEDRSEDAAWATRAAAYFTAAVDWTTRAAARATEAAAYAARVADWATETASWTTEAAVWATERATMLTAEAATWAAEDADWPAGAAKPLDLVAIAHRALGKSGGVNA